MERVIDFDKAVAAFGGYSGLARRLKVPLSTCHGWARRGKLPRWRAKEIVALAKAARKDIYREEEEAPKSTRGARRKKAA